MQCFRRRIGSSQALGKAAGISFAKLFKSTTSIVSHACLSGNQIMLRISLRRSHKAYPLGSSPGFFIGSRSSHCFDISVPADSHRHISGRFQHFHTNIHGARKRILGLFLSVYQAPFLFWSVFLLNIHYAIKPLFIILSDASAVLRKQCIAPDFFCGRDSTNLPLEPVASQCRVSSRRQVLR